MTETKRPSFPATQLAQRVREAESFLKMATIELRRIAERAPDIADDLRHVAHQLEAQAEALAHGEEEGINAPHC